MSEKLRELVAKWDKEYASLVGEITANQVRMICKRHARELGAALAEKPAERPQLSAEQVQDAFEAEGHFDWAAIAKRLNALLTGEAEPSDYVCPRCKKAVPENAPCPYCVPAAPPVLQAEQVRTCVKCGRAGLRPSYHAHRGKCSWNGTTRDDEHLHYLCSCGFDRVEDALTSRALADSPVSGEGKDSKRTKGSD